MAVIFYEKTQKNGPNSSLSDENPKKQNFKN